MIRINLLPHREEKRGRRRREFFVFMGFVAFLACAIVFAAYTVIDGYVMAQEGRNNYLKKEIAKLDKEIDEIKRLKEQTQQLLARKQVIESLQQDRAEPVHLLNELVKQVPEGIYLRSIKQEGAKVLLVGYAQSNARVSTLMRNIEASPWMERPELIEIKATTVEKRRMSEFSLSAFVKRTQKQEAKKK